MQSRREKEQTTAGFSQQVNINTQQKYITWIHRHNQLAGHGPTIMNAECALVRVCVKCAYTLCADLNTIPDSNFNVCRVGMCLDYIEVSAGGEL